MADPSQNQLVAAIARDIVGQIAPHELPLFRATSDAFFRRAARSLKTQGARDEMLGFGTGEDVTFLTPVILAVTDTVVDFIAREISASHPATSASLIGDQVRGVFRRYRSATPAGQPAPLSGAQIARARQLAFQKACHFNLAEAQANTLADAFAGSLAGAIA